MTPDQPGRAAVLVGLVVRVAPDLVDSPGLLDQQGLKEIPVVLVSQVLAGLPEPVARLVQRALWDSQGRVARREGRVVKVLLARPDVVDSLVEQARQDSPGIPVLKEPQVLLEEVGRLDRLVTRVRAVKPVAPGTPARAASPGAQVPQGKPAREG